MLQVVNEDVFSQFIGCGVEDAAAVDLGKLIYELFQVVVAIEHKSIDRDVLSGDSFHCF